MKSNLVNFLLLTVFLSLLPAVDMAQGQGRVVFKQQIVPASTLASPVGPNPKLQAASATPQTTDATTSAAAADTATPEMKLVELMMNARFDRTTPAVLKAWSHSSEESQLKKQDEQNSGSAVVENNYKGFVVFGFELTPKFKVGDEVHVLLRDQKPERGFGQAKLLTVDGKTVTARFVEAESAKDSNEPEKEKLPVKTGDRVTIVLVPSDNSADDIDKANQAKVDEFVRHVTLGNWEAVKEFLTVMKPDDADRVYTHLLNSLTTADNAMAESGLQQQQAQQPAKPHLTPDDILQLADAAPKEIRMEEPKKDDGNSRVLESTTISLPANSQLQQGMAITQLPHESQTKLETQMVIATSATQATAGPQATPNHIQSLARLISNSRTAGHDFAAFHKQIESGTRDFGGDDPVKRLAAADLFMKAGFTQYVEPFLPKLEDDAVKSNLPALKLWSQLALAMHAEKKVAVWLEKAWLINQSIVLIEGIGKADRELALSNLIELSSQIDREIGAEWMNASFTDIPERGMTILENLGTRSADMAIKAIQFSETVRLNVLDLQNEAVEKLIQIAPEQASSWTPALSLLAQNWLTEAETSLTYSQQNSGRDFMQIDMYGNYYWVNQNMQMQMMGGNNQQPQPIKLGDILEIAPSEQWLQLIHSSLHLNLRKTRANLHLRVNEEDKAFPFIEQIADDQPDMARDLVHEFLRIWTQNHNPNSDRQQRNPYIYFYGFDQKAEAIPLTRSKQERNLQELAGWVERIRKMPIDDIDEQALGDAFTTCHSSAEVFRVERFREVFGDLSKLKPETIAAICQKMRANLSANWRDIRNQEEKQTNRREPEVQQEVLRGYQVGLSLANEALQTSPESWQLHLARAALMYDQNAYSQSVQKSSEFSDRRDEAFEQFHLAAEKYATVVSTLEEKDQSTEAFDIWFYAGLGACELGQVSDKTVPDLRQYAKVRNALVGLPGSLAESHMAKFANNLFTRMSPIKPEIKYRYLRGGFEIVGDHPRAWEARSLYDYYKDLVHEIRFVVQIDGSDDVGHSEPFGVYVNILHTAAIERESGGFGKYVQNQNNLMYAWNYGRPTENYRDKFTDSVELALGDHFEILNVTFQTPEAMKSGPAAESGWRTTPYAYVLLKPQGAEVDRIAPLKLDLDFLDTSGYVVIPIESPALVVDCSSGQAPIRPVSDLKVTQTLDERQADDGKLIVEISASAKGLVPDLNEIIDLNRDHFELVSVDDQGVLPTAFDAESDEIQILSDRSWTVEYKATNTEEAISTFSFSHVVLDDATTKFQRYDDADLVETEQVVPLEKSYESFSWSFLYWLIPSLVFGLIGLASVIYFVTRRKVSDVGKFKMPEEINPFTVLTLLKDIRERNGISSDKGLELQTSINRIERYYFGEVESEKPDDLTNIAQSWVRQAK